MAQWWRTRLPMQEIGARFLSREDPLGKEMATHYSILAWEIPWTEKPGRLQSMRSQRVNTSDPIWTISITYFCVRGKRASVRAGAEYQTQGGENSICPKSALSVTNAELTQDSQVWSGTFSITTETIPKDPGSHDSCKLKMGMLALIERDKENFTLYFVCFWLKTLSKRSVSWKTTGSMSFST